MMADDLEDDLLRDLPLLAPTLVADARARGASPPRGDLDLRLRELGPDRLVDLEDRVRWRLDPPAGRATRAGADPAIASLLAMSRDGRVREAGVRALAACPALPAYALAVLLVRANDWVDEVASFALTALEARLAIDSAESWINVLGVLARASRWTRRRFDGLQARVAAKLTSAESALAIARGLQTGAPAIRRACAELAAHAPVPLAALESALDDRDPRVVRRVARALVALVTRGDRERGDALALAARLERGSVELRVLAVRLRAAAPDARAHLLRAACDGAARVREEARFLFERSRDSSAAPFEFRRFYLDALDAGTASAAREGPLRGLVETATAEDLPRFVALTASPARGEREAAFHALVRLGSRQHEALFTAGLADPSSRVRRAARRAARAHLR